MRLAIPTLNTDVEQSSSGSSLTRLESDVQWNKYLDNVSPDGQGSDHFWVLEANQSLRSTSSLRLNLMKIQEFT